MRSENEKPEDLVKCFALALRENIRPFLKYKGQVEILYPKSMRKGFGKKFPLNLVPADKLLASRYNARFGIRMVLYSLNGEKLITTIFFVIQTMPGKGGYELFSVTHEKISTTNTIAQKIKAFNKQKDYSYYHYGMGSTTNITHYQIHKLDNFVKLADNALTYVIGSLQKYRKKGDRLYCKTISSDVCTIDMII